MRQKIDVNEINEGDIIAFSRSNRARNTQHLQYGVVIDVFRKTREVVDFRILPLTPYAKNQRVTNDQSNLMISNNGSLREMGLSTERNWRLKYEYHTIRNTPRDLGVREDGKVTKTGRLDTRLFNSVFSYIERTIGMPDMPKDFDESGFGQGLVGNKRMADLGEDSRAIEKKVKAEDRQKRHTDRKREKAAKASDLPKKVRKRRLPDSVRQLDISLDDAEKLHLITKEVKTLLQNSGGKYAPQIETLRQAYEYIKDKPFMIGSYVSPEADLGYDKAVQKGLADVSETDNITFSAIAEKIAESAGLPKPLSFGQTAAFVELFPDFFKEVSQNTAIRRSHFKAPMNKLIHSWKSHASGDISTDIDLREAVTQIAQGWKNFLASEPHSNDAYKGIQIMYPANKL